MSSKSFFICAMLIIFGFIVFGAIRTQEFMVPSGEELNVRLPFWRKVEFIQLSNESADEFPLRVVHINNGCEMSLRSVRTGKELLRSQQKFGGYNRIAIKSTYSASYQIDAFCFSRTTIGVKAIDGEAFGVKISPYWEDLGPVLLLSALLLVLVFSFLSLHF